MIWSIDYSNAVLVLQQLVSGQQCGTVGRVGSTRTGTNMGNIEQKMSYTLIVVIVLDVLG